MKHTFKVFKGMPIVYAVPRGDNEVFIHFIAPEVPIGPLSTVLSLQEFCRAPEKVFVLTEVE